MMCREDGRSDGNSGPRAAGRLPFRFSRESGGLSARYFRGPIGALLLAHRPAAAVSDGPAPGLWLWL